MTMKMEETEMNEPTKTEIRGAVQTHYAGVATSGTSCCGDGCCGDPDGSAKLGYSPQELAQLPDGADLGLGCGNPQALAELKPGETVLDLGSGPGMDCLLAARQVGPSGRVTGVDMTPQMIERARHNVETAGIGNVDFRLGEIEHLPVPDASVDVVLSNCVINLSPDKPAVFREAFRVLRPGGRLRVSDVVAIAPIPERWRGRMEVLSGCLSGASPIAEIEALLREAGFAEVSVEIDPGSAEFVRDWLKDDDPSRFVASAAIKAGKPAAACCGPTCCG